MSLKGIPSSHVISSKNPPFSVSVITLSSTTAPRRWTGKSEFMKFIVQGSSIICCNLWVRLENITSISLIHVQNFCSYPPLQIRNVLPLPIYILDESHAELVDAYLPYGGSQESINHVRACVTDETAWRMRQAVLWPGSCLTSCVSWGWPTPYQSTGGPVTSWFCLCLWCAGWAPWVCPSNAKSTSWTGPLLTPWPRSASLPVPVWRTSQCC